ncbi:Hypothetical predicted protein [Mytilus galloprovincialis]|nr:Hypothetical predicted protein [Mytilus galloprovincialis]
MRLDHVYWIKAAEYIQMIDGSTRSATSYRSRIVNKLRTTYSTISEAEDAYSCDYEDIREVSNDSVFLEPENITSLSPASDVIEKVLCKSRQRLDVQQSTELIKQFFQQNFEINKKTLLNSLLREDNLLNIYHIFDNSDTITACQRNEMVLKNLDKVSSSDKLCLLDTLFKIVCAENGIKQPPEKCPSLSLKSMNILQEKEKPNVLLDFAKQDQNLIVHLCQLTGCPLISIPDDYYQWLETLDAEFEDRLGRLIRGPIWSGLPSSDVGDPLKARVSIAAVSKRTIQRRTSTSEFTTTPKIQTPAVKSVTESNPNGRFWLKLHGTDVKESLQHSVKDIWNRDVDLNDWQLEVLRTEYQSRLAWINSVHSTTEEDLKTCSGLKLNEMSTINLKYHLDTESAYAAIRKYELEITYKYILYYIEDDKPLRQANRRIQTALVEEVREHVSEMLDAGCIRESNSPYARNAVHVRKDRSLK